MLVTSFAAMLVSFLTALLLIRYIHLHQKLTGDLPSGGPQKFHIGLTPRIGGIPIFLGLFVGGALAIAADLLPVQMGSALLLAAAPVFVLGVAEDISKRVAPLWRLLASFLSAGIACWTVGAIVPGIGLPGIDFILSSYPLVALVFTIVAVGGMCHSLNIIDGYNGLASGVSSMILLALGFVAFEVGDRQLLALCLVCAGAVVGFMVWNFPRGLIFAGDGGAYLLGFFIAEISVLLVARNPEVSPWFPFTLIVYPVWETVFTMYRRKVIRGHAAGLPDALHLHQMVFNRLVRWMVGRREARHLLRRNSMTAPYLWGMGLLTVIPAILVWRYPLALQFCCLVFIVFYLWLYRRLVHFRAPRWMVVHRD
jgi:UDP-N-acetylmuramyl pentapeptide phosphotransferase/UDP-N-acetylglucosamine-1-phosphate transferase